MKIFDRFFKTSSQIPSETTQATVSEPVVEHQVSKVDVLDIATTNEPKPTWLDEANLRDEAVLFGLSNTDPHDKVEAIRSYFNEKTSPYEQKVRLLEEKIGECNYWLDTYDERLETIQNELQVLEEQTFGQQQHLLRTGVGLALSIGTAVGNYFLIEENLAGRFHNYQLIALGVFMAGMFSLFGRLSLFHEGQKPRLWLRIFEEIGMPAAASLFVFAQVFGTMPAFKAFALLGFLFFLFLVSGKLLLENLTLLREDFIVFGQRNTFEKERISKITKSKTEIEQYKNEMDKYRQQKKEILPDLTELKIVLGQHTAQRDRLIRIFESEFQLAQNYAQAKLA
jgi:hypothetical protein